MQGPSRTLLHYIAMVQLNLFLEILGVICFLLG